MDPITSSYDHANRFTRYSSSADETSMRCPAYRRKRYALFAMRTFCLTALYFLLWDIVPLRFTLLLTVPFLALHFFSLVGWRYFLDRKIQRMREGIG